MTELSLDHASQAARNAIISSLILPSLRYPLDRKQPEPAIGVCCLSHLARNHPFPPARQLATRSKPLRSTRTTDLSKGQRDQHATFGRSVGGVTGTQKILTFDTVDFEGPSAGESYLSCLGRACPRLRGLISVLCMGYTLESLFSVVEQRRRGEGLDSLAHIVLCNPSLPAPGTRNVLERLERLVEFESTVHAHANYTLQPHTLTHSEWTRCMEV